MRGGRLLCNADRQFSPSTPSRQRHTLPATGPLIHRLVERSWRWHDGFSTALWPCPCPWRRCEHRLIGSPQRRAQNDELGGSDGDSAGHGLLGATLSYSGCGNGQEVLTPEGLGRLRCTRPAPTSQMDGF